MEQMGYERRMPLKKGDELIDYICSLRYEDIPEKVIRQTKRALLDDLSSACAGRRTLEKNHKLIDDLFPDVEEVTVFGSSKKTDLQSAAFLLGTYITYHDFTDGFNCSGIYSSSFHPGRVIVPAALLMAQKCGVSGRDLLTAMVAAYDVAERIRNPKYIGISVADAMAGAAAAAKIAGADRRQMRNAMNIAAYFCPCHNLGMGENAGNIYDVNYIGNGELVRAAVSGALMAMKGLTGPAFHDDPNYTRRYAVHGLGKDFSVMHLYFKPYPTCRKTHAAIELALRYRNEYHICPEDIEKIIIYQQHAGMYVDQPVTEQFGYLKKQFSLQYETACAFIDGAIRFERLDDSDSVAPEIYRLAQRIEVVPDDSLDGCCETSPNHAAMDLILKDGSVRSLYEPFPCGSEPNPMTMKQAEQKFAWCTEGWIGENERAELLDRIMHVDELEQVGCLWTKD